MTDVKDSFAFYLNEAFTEGAAATEQQTDLRSAQLGLSSVSQGIWKALPTTTSTNSFNAQIPTTPENASRKILPFAAAAVPAVYVNPKQYKRIIIRRQNRMRLERLISSRVPKRTPHYLHESRHVHAMKRQRGPGGRFMPLSGSPAASKQEPEKVSSLSV
jgi:hypothetical protein